MDGQWKDPDLEFGARMRRQGVPPTTVIHIKDAPPNWKRDPRYVYIGRGSKWGNPYRIGDSNLKHNPNARLKFELTRDDVCNLYEKKVLPRLVREGELRYLRGKTLVCYCSPQRCHGDSLAKAAEEHQQP